MNFAKKASASLLSATTRRRLRPRSAGNVALHSRSCQIKGRGSIRLRFEDWDFFKAQAGDNAYGYGAALLRVSAGRQFHSQDWLFELCQGAAVIKAVYQLWLGRWAGRL